MTFTEARIQSRMTLEEISSYLELSLKTVKRYEKEDRAPKAIIECLLMLSGQCPTFQIKNNFNGWSFGFGFIYSPEGDKFTSGDIRAGKIALLEMNRLHRLSVRKRHEKKKENNIIPFPMKFHNTASSA